MRAFLIAFTLLISLVGVALAFTTGDESARNESDATANNIQSPLFEYADFTPVNIPEDKAIATFAGGCFWCVEAVFQETNGVDDVISGFAGGTEVAPSYDQVVRGLTTHREAIQFIYDPAIISYKELLGILWQAIDPTDAGGQFVDRGFIYTTAVFYHDDMQKAATERSLASLQQKRSYADDEIATQLLPYSTFYTAEEYHQDYYLKSSDNYKRYETNSGRPEYKQSLEAI